MSITLVVMVKDEAQVIRRLLCSCMDLADNFFILDTGSKDNTIGEAQAWAEQFGFADKLRIERTPFARWDVTRTFAINQARLHFGADWLLLLDADEVFVGKAEDVRRVLDETQHPSACIPMVIDGVLQPRVNLIRNDGNWAYKYSFDEQLLHNDQPQAACVLIGNTEQPTEGTHILHYGGGARSKDPLKDAKDLLTLQALWGKTRDPHYAFFAGLRAAQLKQLVEARDSFLCYLAAAGSAEPGKAYIARLNLARIAVEQSDQDNVTSAYLRAHATMPTRPEALGELAVYHAHKRNWALAKLFALGVVHDCDNDCILGYDPSWKAWRGMDILALALFNLGEYRLCERYATNLRYGSAAKQSALPATEHSRLEDLIERARSAGQPAPEPAPEPHPQQ